MGNCQSQGILQRAYTPILGRLGSVTELRMVNSVWLKDYQGLFDFESKEVRRQILTLSDCGFVFKDNKNKYARNGKQKDFSQQIMKDALFQVIKRPNFYKILPILIDNQQYMIQRPLWLVVRTVPQQVLISSTQKYPVQEKDVLKFGKLKIKIRQIVPLESSFQGSADFNSIKTEKKIYEDVRYQEEQTQNLLAGKEDLHNDIVSIATENEQTCRICLEPGEQTNPLICPCKCTGSVRYIHLTCLRTWLGKQLKMSKTKHVISIKWTPLSCEMCKTHYKYRIYLDNKKYYTVQIPKPAKPYIVMQIGKKSAEYSKIFHFISMSETSKLTIGRKKDIDIKLSEDISVSRHHANLLYDFQGKRFLIQDNKSKFGTLVQVKRNLLVNPFQRGITLQLSGELFTFETNRGQGAIPDYHDQLGYLNVVDKGEKVQDEESDQNNDEDDDYDGEQEEPQNPTNVIIPNHSNVSAQSMPVIPQPQVNFHEELPFVENIPLQNQIGIQPGNALSQSGPLAQIPNPQPQHQEQPPLQASASLHNNVSGEIQVQNLDY